MRIMATTRCSRCTQATTLRRASPTRPTHRGSPTHRARCTHHSHRHHTIARTRQPRAARIGQGSPTSLQQSSSTHTRILWLARKYDMCKRGPAVFVCSSREPARPQPPCCQGFFSSYFCFFLYDLSNARFLSKICYRSSILSVNSTELLLL